MTAASHLRTKVPLVLISGLLSNEQLWKHQKEALSALTTIHVVSPIQDTPEGMVKAVLDNSPSLFALAGHSMGGWVCLEIMRTAPERVTRLCLLNTTAESDTAEKKARRLQMIDRTENGQFEKVVEEIASLFVFKENAQARVKSMFLKVGPEAFIAQEKAMLARGDTLPILPSIRCPTLVVHALQDHNFTLEEHQRMANSIPDARLTTVADSGHMSPIEASEAVSQVLIQWYTESSHKNLDPNLKISSD